MQMTDSMIQVTIHRTFSGAVLGHEDGRFIVDGILTLERKPVVVKRIGGQTTIPGFLAVLDTGEDAVEIYEGPSLWSALKAMGHEWLDFKVDRLEDEVNPCCVPRGRPDLP